MAPTPKTTPKSGKSRKRVRSESPETDPIEDEISTLVRPLNFTRDEIGLALSSRVLVQPKTREEVGYGFERLGGMDHAVDVVTRAVTMGIRGREAHTELGIKVATHFLLCGNSGHGKSCFIKGLKTFASRFPDTRIACFQPDSADQLADVFHSARRLQPSLICIDPLKQAMTLDLERELDLLNNDDMVFIVATAKDVNQIDRSLKVGWRLGATLQLTLPSDQERKEILQKLTTGWGNVAVADLDNLVGRTRNWTAGELACCCQNAARIAMRRINPLLSLSTAANTGASPTTLTMPDFDAAVALRV